MAERCSDCRYNTVSYIIETKVTTEDGKKYVETHDGSGRYTTTLTNRDEIGFVPGVVMDFQVGEVLPGLILASQDVAAELPILEQYRVTHVLNVASRVDNFFQEKIKYTNLRIADHPYFNILQFFQEAFECIDEGRESGCVLVHCNAGRSRAATLAIGYLMKTEQLSLENAYAHVKEKRPSILPNEGFLAQLKVYEEQLGLAKNAESND